MSIWGNSATRLGLLQRPSRTASRVGPALLGRMSPAFRQNNAPLSQEGGLAGGTWVPSAVSERGGRIAEGVREGGDVDMGQLSDPPGFVAAAVSDCVARRPGFAGPDESGIPTKQRRAESGGRARGGNLGSLRGVRA